MLWMLSKRICFASQYSGQWRKKWFIDSMSPKQMPIGFIVSLAHVHCDDLNQDAT